MRKLLISAIFLVSVVLGNGEENKFQPEPTKITPIPNPNSTTHLPPTTPPTPPPTTSPTPPPTTKPTTTPTTKPTTTPTTKPTTPPTTKPTTPPTTKPTPPTTEPPTPKPSPPPKPVPPPKPETGSWALNYTKDNKTCILLQMAVQFDVPYDTVDNKTLNATVVLPKNANVSGVCEQKSLEQQIVLSWLPDNTTNSTNSLTFYFLKNDTCKQVMLKMIQASFYPDKNNFPGSKSNSSIQVVHNKYEFTTPTSKSYKCAREETMTLNVSGNANRTAKFVVTDLQLEAFHNATGKEFSSAEDCESNETPGIVPIAVGCSLAALIIIVLIAYLVGRRRSQARGYLSMFSQRQREEDYIPMKRLPCFGR